MIRSALRSVSYLVEDVVSVAKWAVGELVSELDYRLQPVHVRQGWAAAETLNDIEAEIDSHKPNAPYLQWGGPETWPQNPYCNRCGYPHPTTQKCLRDATAEDWVRGTAEACGVDPERCVSRLSFEDAESSAVPPAAERPAGVVADPPSAPPAGHPYYEVFVPEEDRVPTSELLDSAAHMIGLFNRDNVATALMSQLRTRAEQFKAVENTT
ncbi:hypothetical protein [Mycolicibacterium austroafricanum]|uniref:hypothetical protein n=1 Tax=Mycolicibacterium austroafricanum TaxID=39687 RepID=UPI001ABF33F9|nr:hypothetical protein [Mycolicibacterium austroafricanum]QRZ05929.1 hypothetical protein JN090_23875 [Mycolicibacterium austroafricanum]